MSTPMRRAIGAISLHRREVHVVLRAGRDPVRVDAVRVERDGVLVGQQAVVRQIPVELPRLVAVVQAEAGEHRGQRERLARPHDAERAPGRRPGSRCGPAPRTAPGSGRRGRSPRPRAATIPSKPARDEGRSLRSSTMNALRSPSASEIHSPGPASASPGAGRVRLAPGARVRIADRERAVPASPGSRQSPPARKEWIVGAHGAGGAASSSAALREHQRRRRVDHGLRAKARHARIGLRDRASRPGPAPSGADEPHRDPQAAPLRASSRSPSPTVNRSLPSSSPADRQGEVAATRRSTRGPCPAGRPAPPSETAPGVQRRRPSWLPSSIERQPDVGATGPSRIGLRIRQPRARRTAPSATATRRGSASSRTAVGARPGVRPVPSSSSVVREQRTAARTGSGTRCPCRAVSPAPRSSEHVTRSPIVVRHVEEVVVVVDRRDLVAALVEERAPDRLRDRPRTGAIR